MLHGTKENIEKHLPYLSDELQKALRFLAETDCASLASGDYPIDGADIIAKVSTYLTEPKEDRKPERHDVYIDVHYLAKGREAIWYKDCPAGLAPVEDYAKEKDLLFYPPAAETNVVLAEEGDWVVFFPWELHRPNCFYGDRAEEVKKVVVKVRAR